MRLVHHRHRQERWLHARISENLEGALKREARRRRLPVSLLVRNVLEGALDLVEDIVENSMGVARRSQGLARPVRERGPLDGLADVYGWQAIVLNRDAECARCHVALPRGTASHRGLRERTGPPVFLCTSCLAQLGRATPDSTNHKEESP
jgi:hypothetical protein